MGKKIIGVLVEGGKATAGPPLGPQLGPMGVNIGSVVEEINKKTANLAGMKVPVKVIVDEADKSFVVEVGTPPTAALIKKELGIRKASGKSGLIRSGDLTEDQIKSIAVSKFNSDDPAYLNQVKGTCRSMGVTIGQGPLTEEEKKEAEEALKEAAASASPADDGAKGEKKEGAEGEDKEEGTEEEKEGAKDEKKEKGTKEKKK